MSKINEAARRYKDIKDDYTFNDDIMDEDPVLIRRLKYIVSRRLNQVDRTILILYADCESLRDLGEYMGISHTIMQREVERIRGKIREEYEHLFGVTLDFGNGGIHR